MTGCDTVYCHVVTVHGAVCWCSVGNDNEVVVVLGVVIDLGFVVIDSDSVVIDCHDVVIDFDVVVIAVTNSLVVTVVLVGVVLGLVEDVVLVA